ncbi:hypothetical protein [Clostridium formicaceticum]|uniref:Uncharacterized protein n=1 Tax=Clostridium formicaceticum TaxID=1497 RepID=A0AAC9WHT6_9CLOT|nr:hypothetical protein [Clostridium formicaceticum]AOY74903.1 hypothetical protein BJL90_02375 [Clostridium formicaceticum]ARE89308.1 hypothetical protein CLFO_37150 [Clostridium formicaceticum]
MTLKIDKMIAVGGSALLGYYLGLSILRSLLWKVLLWTLPPINTRHTPRFYTGLIAATIAASIGYLLYIWLVDKWSIGRYKKQYASGLTALILLPLITMGSFRIHTVSIVKNAEASTPTGLHLRFEEPTVVFQITETSGTVFGKSIRLQDHQALLETFGTALQQLTLIEVSNDPQNIITKPQGTLWIDYRPQGKWYSKIITWGQDTFEEFSTNQKRLLYQGNELEAVLEEFNRQLATLTNYVSGKVIHTSFIDGDFLETKAMPQEDFEFLLANLSEDHKTSPEGSVASRFEEVLNNREGISKQDNNFYAFSLSNQPADASLERDILLENVILYDDEEKVAWFEEVYYEVDLSSILVKKE